jgi:cell wall-associated NlpC family hydrolase
MTRGDVMAAAALALVGAPFRLHGRVADHGLDCVGLAMAAARAADVAVGEPGAYRLRGLGRATAEDWLRAAGLRRVRKAAAGDIVLVAPGPLQLHLLVRTEGGHVHAHAGLGRVVWMADPVPWPVLSRWRLIERR